MTDDFPRWLQADPLTPRLPGLTPDEVAEVAERAAMYEFDEGMERERAEFRAMREHYRGKR